MAPHRESIDMDTGTVFGLAGLVVALVSLVYVRTEAAASRMQAETSAEQTRITRRIAALQASIDTTQDIHVLRRGPWRYAVGPRRRAHGVALRRGLDWHRRDNHRTGQAAHWNVQPLRSGVVVEVRSDARQGEWRRPVPGS